MAISAESINFGEFSDDLTTLSLDLLQGAIDEPEPDRDLDVADVVVTSSNEGRTVAVDTDLETGALTLDTTQFGDLAFEATETITVTYNIIGENEGDILQNTATFVVEGTGAAPVNNLPTVLEVDEDEVLSLSGENLISIDDEDDNLSRTTLSVNEGILSVVEDDALTITGNESDTVKLSGSQDDINAALESLEYAGAENFNGTDLLSIISTDSAGLLDADAKTIKVVSVNDQPTLEIPLAEQIVEGDNLATEDEAFSLMLDEGTFADLLDPEDMLTFSALVEGGEVGVYEPLPESGWLEFDAETITFSGTPENEDVGELNLKVIATDEGGLQADDTFSLTVENTNDAPTVTNTFHDQFEDETLVVEGAILNGSDANIVGENDVEYTHYFNLREEREFSITLPEDAFDDVDVDDQLTYTATLSNGDSLPNSMSFDPETLTLSGIPDDEAVNEESYSIMITATDMSGESVSENVILDIENFNDAPILDLNGLDEPSRNFVAEGVTPTSDLTLVVDRDLSLTDVDNDTLNAATVRIFDPSNGFSESLTADTRGTDIQKTYDPNRGVLYLIGEDSVENYQDVLRTVEYANSFDSGINQELILGFGVWDFPEFDYPSFDYPYFGSTENPFDLDSENLDPEYIDEMDGEFPFPEYQVASAISYTQFETDTTVGFEEGGEGGELFIADTDGGDTDDEFEISLDSDNNTVVIDSNSDFSINHGFSDDLGEFLLGEEFQGEVKGIGFEEDYYFNDFKPGIQAINGQAEVDFDWVYEVNIASMAGEDSISVDISDLDLLESYMGSNLYISIYDEGFSNKGKGEDFPDEESEANTMPSNELELKGILNSGDPFDTLYHEFEMDYGVTIDAKHDNPEADIEDNYYNIHDSVGISYDTGSMKTVVDELDVNERIYQFESYEGVTVTINDNEVEGDGKSMISSDLSSESVIFSNPNTALKIETYDYESGNDAVYVDGLDSSFVAELMINTYGGDDTIVGGDSDEILVGGADKDMLTGGAGSDTFVLESLTDSLVAGFAFDVITDLDIDSDMIEAPMAVMAEDVNDFGVLASFSVPAATELLMDLEANKAGTLEFQSRTFLVINDSNAGFSVTDDAVVEITGFSGSLDDLMIGGEEMIMTEPIPF